MVLHLALGLGITLAISWLVLVVVLIFLREPGQSITDLVAVFPNAIRLAARLYRDPTMPKGVRWRLRLALLYSVQPFNLIPDFIPVIGFSDNVVILAWALRSSVRRAGIEAVVRHWNGSAASLEVLCRSLRLGPVVVVMDPR